MKVVVSYIRPDRTAVIHGSYSTTGVASIVAAGVLMRLTDAPSAEASELERELRRLSVHGTAVEHVHQSSGYTFRLDSDEYPPNVCVCCSGLVRPSDHESAGMEDALCLGCFTWKRDVPACLPANSAHTLCPEGHEPGGCSLCDTATTPWYDRPDKETSV